MSSVRQSSDDGGERPTTTQDHQEAPGLEHLTVIGPDGALLAWAGPGRWRQRETEDLNVVVVPILHLSQTLVFRLVHSRGLPDIFQGCCICAPGILFLDASPVAGKFTLYRTGRPELVEAAFVLEGSKPGSIQEIVTAAASLLT